MICYVLLCSVKFGDVRLCSCMAVLLEITMRIPMAAHRCAHPAFTRSRWRCCFLQSVHHRFFSKIDERSLFRSMCTTRLRSTVCASVANRCSRLCCQREAVHATESSMLDVYLHLHVGDVFASVLALYVEIRCALNSDLGCCFLTLGWCCI